MKSTKCKKEMQEEQNGYDFKEERLIEEKSSSVPENPNLEETSQIPPVTFTIGQDVEITGVNAGEQYSHLNGQHGLAMNLNEETGLYHVMLDEVDAFLPVENFVRLIIPYMRVI